MTDMAWLQRTMRSQLWHDIVSIRINNQMREVVHPPPYPAMMSEHPSVGPDKSNRIFDCSMRERTAFEEGDMSRGVDLSRGKTIERVGLVQAGP